MHEMTADRDIMATLAERVDQTRRLFGDIAPKLLRSHLVDRERTWAIVGGSVRDALLQHPRMQRLFLISPDIDVAVTAQTPFRVAVERLTKAGAEVSTNTFGGWKVRLSGLGVLDLWSWGSLPAGHDGLEFWRQRLELVDFGLNAVAFIWPEGEVLIHPRWKEDVSRRWVEKLYAESPKRELQVVRAVSLLVKAQKLLGGTVRLGPRVRRDLSWLLKEASGHEVNHALHYLREKTDTRRWPRTTVTRFLGRCRHYKRSAEVEEAISAILRRPADVAAPP